jgi:hypothetical protein
MKFGRKTRNVKKIGAQLTFVLLLLPCVSAAAEPIPSAPGGSEAKSESPRDARKAEAANRFDRALKLFEAGDNAGALAEFKRTYEVFADPIVLYNMGLVYAAMSRPVDAVDALEPLVQGNLLPPAQLERAKQTLTDQAARIGRLKVTTIPEDARIEIDGIEVTSTSSKGAIRVSEGKHIVGAVAEGYAPARKELFIAGNSEASLNLELILTQGKQLANISVRSRITGAEVLVDGRVVGTTPLAASVSVPSGLHQVEVRRPGYVTEHREVTVGSGATSELSFELAVDPSSLSKDGVTLIIDSTERPFEVSIDGERLGAYVGPLRLPRGAHHLSVSAVGFLPYEKDITLGGTQTNLVTTVLEPTPETRNAYESSARAHRTWGLVGLIGGTAIAAAGTVLTVIEQGKKSDSLQALSDIKKKYNRDEAPCDSSSGYAPTNDDGALCRKTLNAAQSDFDRAKLLRNIGLVGVGVGGAVAVTGLVIWLTGNDPNKYAKKQETARFMVVPGPGDFGTGLIWAF